MDPNPTPIFRVTRSRKKVLKEDQPRLNMEPELIGEQDLHEGGILQENLFMKDEPNDDHDQEKRLPNDGIEKKKEDDVGTAGSSCPVFVMEGCFTNDAEPKSTKPIMRKKGRKVKNKDVSFSEFVDAVLTNGPPRRMNATKKISGKRSQKNVPGNPPSVLTKKRKREEEFTVDYIMNKRETVFGGMVDYLVKWEGYSEQRATWEPREHVQGCVFLEAFEEELKASQMKNVVHQYTDTDDLGFQSEEYQDAETGDGVVSPLAHCEDEEIPTSPRTVSVTVPGGQKKILKVLHQSASYVVSLVLNTAIFVGGITAATVVLSNL